VDGGWVDLLGTMTNDLAPIPEPASLLATAGLLASGLLLRRRTHLAGTGLLQSHTAVT
jgi:hypothetical protein